MRRVSILGGKNTINIYKSLPTLEVDKDYIIKVEQLSIPEPIHETNFEKQRILTLEHRVLHGNNYYGVFGNIPLGGTQLFKSYAFKPSNCQTVEDFVYQLNEYFRHSISLDLTQNWAGGPEFSDQEHVIQGEDWYNIYSQTRGQFAEYRDCVQAFVRSDGRLYIQFTPFGMRHYVIHLTDYGRELLGHTDSFFVPAGEAPNLLTVSFDHAYIDEFGNSELRIPAIQDNIFGCFKNNLYNHEQYRDEIVVESTLPMRDHIFVNKRQTDFVPMLASFRLPERVREIEYDNKMNRTYCVSGQRRYNLEDGGRTHNTFYLTHSRLQNFHLRLVQRKYERSSETGLMNIKDTPYEIPEGDIWMIRLAISG